MKEKGSIALFQYWNQLRDGRLAPKRSEVEPADIKSLLADTFILERDTRGEAVFRLAGTRLCAYYGRELKGFSFPSLWREKDQRLMSRLMQGVFDQKSVLLMTYEGFSRNGRSNKFELLSLPLDGGAENQRCLGIITTAGGNGIAGYSGDGGPAANATLDHPIALVVDGAGNVYVSDFNQSVRRLRPVAQ